MNKSKELAITCIHKGKDWSTYCNHCFTNKLDAMNERSYYDLTKAELGG